MSTPPLAPLPRGRIAPLQTGRLPRRLAQLLVGVILYGVAIGLIVRAALGLSPWDVFHAGVLRHTGGSFGTVVIVVGIAVLLLWIPLRQQPGLGTVANVVLVGASIDATLAALDQPEPLLGRAFLLVLGIGLNGVAGALYLGARLGPSARDGLMTGLARRTGWSLRLVRTGIELSVLAVGFALGGAVGVGTILYAVTIGPLVHFFLPLFTVRQPQTE